jgi:CO/xanthine dehydrogenase Mo-binding subunit
MSLFVVPESFGSYIAQVAEVSVSKKGEVKVHRLVCAIDCGPAVNRARSARRWKARSYSA